MRRSRRRYGDTPPGWPILLAGAVLIYAPLWIVQGTCWLIDRLRQAARAADDNLADFGTED